MEISDKSRGASFGFLFSLRSDLDWSLIFRYNLHLPQGIVIVIVNVIVVLGSLPGYRSDPILAFAWFLQKADGRKNFLFAQQSGWKTNASAN